MIYPWIINNWLKKVLKAAETIDKMFANEDEIEEAKLEVKEDKKAIEELTSDDVNAYRKAKQEMTRLGFESYDEYLDYLDFKSKVGNRK